MKKSGIVLGKDNNGNDVFMPAKTRSTHMHVIGSTGTGKSKFFESMIRQDILNRQGLCLIDPHGYLFHDIIRWCETMGLRNGRLAKNIVLLDPSADGWAFGFNPLRGGSCEISYHVDTMVKAVSKVWGGENSDRTPLLKRALRSIFHVLAENELSLLEGRFLIDPVHAETRKKLTENISDPVIKQQWDYFNELKPKPFYDEFGSTINRLMEFFSSPLIRAMIGQTEKVIDFRSVMDEGKVVLVNLSSSDRVSPDNARLLGSLIVNDLFMRAMGRPEGSRPFYLYIDECSLFVNEDIERILNEGRKFGLHLILAHQQLKQLKKQAGEGVYDAVMGSAKTKVIFGGLSYEDAEVMANQVFLGEIDLEEGKKSLRRKAVTGQVRIWMKSMSEGESESTGRGEADSWSETETTSTGDSSSASLTFHESGLVRSQGSGMSSGESFSTSSSKSVSSFSSEGKNRSNGIRESFQNVYTEQEGGLFSLEEQRYKKMAVMVNQEPRQAVVKLPAKRSNVIETPFVREGIARRERVERFKRECFGSEDFAMTRKDAERLIDERHVRLTAGEAPENEEEITGLTDFEIVDDIPESWKDLK